MHLLFIFNAKLTGHVQLPRVTLRHEPNAGGRRWTMSPGVGGLREFQVPIHFPMSATTKLMSCKDLMRYSPI